MKPDYSVTELFPPQPPPVQTPLSREERLVIARFRDHREKIRNGPMYTVMAKKGVVDPFNDVSKYSRRYQKMKRRVPKLDARPYVAAFFPTELHQTLGISPTTNGTIPTPSTNKKLVFSSLDALNPLDEISDSEHSDNDDEEGEKPVKGGLLQRIGESGDEMGDDDEDENEDDFGDDEEGDYNAEGYFDGDDVGEDYGDGDGGGEDFY